MQINDKTVHERRVTTHLEHDELARILINHIAKQAGFTQTGKTKTEVIFHQSHHDGKGMVTTANVTLVNELE